MESLKNSLSTLVSISSPSGYEEGIVSYLKKEITEYSNLQIENDILGNLIVTKQGLSSRKIMLIAHCDEIGLMVSYIEDSGYIRFTKIGGVDLRVLQGHKVKILHNNTEVCGVIGITPIHMRKNGNNKELEESDLWIDIGCTKKTEVESKVSIGDAIIIDSTFVEISNDIISGRGLDNKVGIVTLLTVLKSIYKIECDATISFVFSVQEEIGSRGAKTAAYFLSPDTCIAVDVAHATDYPTINKAKYGDISLGKGPIIPFGSDFTPFIQNQLRQLAQHLNIEHQQVAMSGFSGTDVNVIQINKVGCKTGFISIPCRYMHTPIETISLADISKTSLILTEFCKLKQ